jgi:ribonuclease J
VRIIPLGGLGEIGKNMTLFETDRDMVIIDCGVGFPDEDLLGIDLVIPDFSYLREHGDKLRGVVLTHGHEDHIGGIPYLLKEFNVPVYGTALTIGIIEAKLREHKLPFRPRLTTVRAGDRVQLGEFEAEFIHVNHSIADACAIALSTPAGIIVHSGDFKLDVSPIEGPMMDLVRFGELGRKGVKLLMCESTNSERPGFTPSEKSVGGVLENVFSLYPEKRIVVATFSSNVHRVMQIIGVSVRHGRRVAITGRSMQTVISAAIELGYMKPPADSIIDVADVKKYAPGQVTLITTGSQGEPMSGLYRMAFSDHAQVSLGASDVVVFSSSAIPGNEKLIGRIINELTRNGIKVIYDSNFSGIHASGHACSEEIKLLIQLCRPDFYMPVHGEYRHLGANRELALFTGIPADRIVTADIGSVVELGRRSAVITGTVPAGRTLIDGLGVGDVGKAVLRDRKALAEEGMVIIFASVDLGARLVLNPPEVITKGFIYTPESEGLIKEVQEIVSCELGDAVVSRRKADLETVRERVRRAVSKMLVQRTGRNPMVIPFIADL